MFFNAPINRDQTRRCPWAWCGEVRRFRQQEKFSVDQTWLPSSFKFNGPSVRAACRRLLGPFEVDGVMSRDENVNNATCRGLVSAPHGLSKLTHISYAWPWQDGGSQSWSWCLGNVSANEAFRLGLLSLGRMVNLSPGGLWLSQWVQVATTLSQDLIRVKI